MKRELINAEKLGSVQGAYSQGIQCGDFIFTTQIGSRKDGSIPETMYEQAKQALENIRDCLAAADAGLRDLVKCTIFISDMEDYAEMNRAYGELIPGGPYPVRACLQAAGLSPAHSKIEIEAIAYTG